LYEYEEDETWKTWPARQPLDDFMLSSAEPLISDIVDDFFHQLLPPLEPLVDRFTETVRAAQFEFETLKDELTTYNRTTIVGAEFVRYTLMLCDFK